MATSSRDGHDLVVSNANLLNGSAVRTGRVSVGIRDGSIVTISEDSLAGDEVFDAEGAWLSPGLIDSHVHMFDPISCTDEASMSSYLDEVMPQHFQSFFAMG